MAPDKPSAGKLREMNGGQSSAARRTMREEAGADVTASAWPCARAGVEESNKQRGKPTVRRKRMLCSYGLARLHAGAATGLAVGLLKLFLIKIMLPQKKEFSKLFICTLKFFMEIK